MIEQLIDLFDAAVTAPVVTKHGLAILGPDGPMKRTQTGQYTPIAVDNEAPWSYWRIGDIKSTPYDIYACSMGALQQVPLRLVVLLPNDCGQRDILFAAGRAVSATTGAAKELLGAARVRVVGQRIAVDGVGQAEKISDIPLQWSLIAIDMDLEVIGTADCLVGCEDGPSVLCSVITTATNADVVECLGDRINEICESGPCDPVTVASSDGEYSEVVPCGDGLILPDVTHTDSNGTPVTLPAQTPFVATPCVTPTPTTVNGVESDTPAITVVQDGSPIGTLDPLTGEVDIPVCPPSGTGYAQLYDDDSPTPNPIGSPVAIPAGTTVPITAPHGTVMTTDGSTPVMDVLSGGTANLPGMILRYKDEANVEQNTGELNAEFVDPYLTYESVIPRRELKDSASAGIGLYATLGRLSGNTIPNIPDSTVNIQRKDSAGTNIGAVIPVAVKATATLAQNVTAPDGSVQPKDSAGTNIGSAVAVKSNGTANAPIADSAVTVNGASFASVKATQGLNVPVKDDVGTVVGAKVGSEWIVKRDPLILDFTDSYQYSQLITINAYNAGTFNTPSTSGSMGTLTYSKNGGAYVAIATPGTFAIGDTVRFLRTSTGTAQLVWQR